MKKTCILLALLLITLFIQCQPGNEKAETGKDSTLSDNPLEQPMLTDSAALDDKQHLNEAARSQNVEQAKEFLQSYFKEDLQKGLLDTMSRQFLLQEADLNNDGKDELFVGLTGPYFCGSGGCTFLLLDQRGKLITKFTVSDYPVFVDTTVTRGWEDLLVQSRGKFHRLKFSGTKYPGNPSVAPVIDSLPSKGTQAIFDQWEDKDKWQRF